VLGLWTFVKESKEEEDKSQGTLDGITAAGSLQEAPGPVARKRKKI